MGSNWMFNNVTIDWQANVHDSSIKNLRPKVSRDQFPPASTFKKSMDRVGPLASLQHGLNLNHVVNEIEDVRALFEFVYTGTVTVSNDRLGHLGRLAECLQFEGLSRAIGQLIASTVPTSTSVMHPERIADQPSAQSGNAAVQNSNWNIDQLQQQQQQQQHQQQQRPTKSNIPFSVRIANIQKEQIAVPSQAVTTMTMATTEPAVGYTLLTPVVHRPSIAIGHFTQLKNKDALQHAMVVNDLHEEPTSSETLTTTTTLTPMTLRIAHVQDAFKKTLSGYMLEDYRRNSQSNLTRNSITFESMSRNRSSATTTPTSPSSADDNVRTVDDDPSGTESEDAADSRSGDGSGGRQHHGAWKRAKRETETPEQRRMRLENEARYRRERRVLGTTDEARKRQLERNAARMRAKRAAETPEQRRIRRENEARYRRELRATETEEKRQRRLQRDSARQRANRAARSRRRKMGTDDPGSAASTEASCSNPSDVFNNAKVNVESTAPAINPTIIKDGGGLQVAIKNGTQVYGTNDYWQLTSSTSDAEVHHERVGLPSSEFVDQFVRFLDSTHNGASGGARVEFRQE